VGKSFQHSILQNILCLGFVHTKAEGIMIDIGGIKLVFLSKFSIHSPRLL
jgi:hypothetical protein